MLSDAKSALNQLKPLLSDLSQNEVNLMSHFFRPERVFNGDAREFGGRIGQGNGYHSF
ncbi:MAG: hypothetical protein Ct9H90mP27_7530 [Gammaproteobacteria bacterium]|nr:MAG: hypothetical protein Ct9H90mP27_7530 [Gammaproteobacteria bacterium]